MTIALNCSGKTGFQERFSKKSTMNVTEINLHIEELFDGQHICDYPDY